TGDFGCFISTGSPSSPDGRASFVGYNKLVHTQFIVLPPVETVPRQQGAGRTPPGGPPGAPETARLCGGPQGTGRRSPANRVMYCPCDSNRNPAQTWQRRPR